MRFIDKDGEWVQNTGGFRIPDYGRESEMVFLEPGEITKIRISEYIAGQAVVIKIDDPMEAEAEAPKKTSLKK